MSRPGYARQEGCDRSRRGGRARKIDGDFRIGIFVSAGNKLLSFSALCSPPVKTVEDYRETIGGINRRENGTELRIEGVLRSIVRD